ncbi:hypothetical protein [Ktedonobacter racemifer]|uniref:Uncharacterized protein n=1 Tax=Ktedonobacter racemifer DSM 44963 TaxID=485913 RepID=D6TNB7_KTERA|nr:hypothetical protein [Ktedonobacter racemifer]EFH85430.1 hypothetical protein Krac_6651 [Ktedonobacter racemifer DSM 44963]
MKYIEAAIILLGLIIGAIVGSMIPIGNGNAAFIGALLVPALGLLVLFFIKLGRRKMSLEERNQQNQFVHQHYVNSANSTVEQAQYIATKLSRR